MVNKLMVQEQEAIRNLGPALHRQAAGEDPTAGGYYTTLLLESAEEWQKTRYSAGFHSTKNAHDYAAGKLPSQQKPEYKPSWLEYPLGVK